MLTQRKLNCQIQFKTYRFLSRQQLPYLPQSQWNLTPSPLGSHCAQLASIRVALALQGHVFLSLVRQYDEMLVKSLTLCVPHFPLYREKMIIVPTLQGS